MVDLSCNNSIRSEWYQKYSRAGPALVTVQSHMVMWSVDTLPQLFEVPPFFVNFPAMIKFQGGRLCCRVA